MQVGRAQTWRRQARHKQAGHRQAGHRHGGGLPALLAAAEHMLCCVHGPGGGHKAHQSAAASAHTPPKPLAAAHELTRCGRRCPLRLQETFGTYMRATGHGIAAKCLAAHDKYGLNMFEVPVPPFLALLRDHLVAPFFCFQVGSARQCPCHAPEPVHAPLLTLCPHEHIRDIARPCTGTLPSGRRPATCVVHPFERGLMERRN